MKTYEMMQVPCILFLPRKSLLRFLLIFFICNLLAIVLFFIGKSSSVLKSSSIYILFIALLSLVFPFVITFISRKSFISKGVVSFTLNDVSIAENKSVNTIGWNDIEYYNVVPNKGTSIANYYLIEIKERNGKKKSICIVDNNLIKSNGEINDSSVLAKFCQYVNLYNKQQNNESDSITLQTNLYAKKGIKYLLIIPAAVILFDIIYRIQNPNIGFKLYFFTFLIALVLMVNILFGGKNNIDFYNAVLKLHSGEN